MAIKIKTQVPEIPVEIGKYTFTIDASDESLKKFSDTYKQFKGDADKLENNDDYEADHKQTKDMLERAYDTLLGEGAFKKLHEQTPSIFMLGEYFVQICESLDKEFEALGIKRSQKQKAEKYIQSKKK